MYFCYATLGVCCGFQVLSSAESENVAFTLLRTRFAKGKKKTFNENTVYIQYTQSILLTSLTSMYLQLPALSFMIMHATSKNTA